MNGPLCIAQCLLESRNPRVICGTSIAERVRAQGKEHLWGERPGVPVDTLVIHSISAANVRPRAPHSEEAILAILTDYGVSSHYLIDRRGHILQLVPEEGKAWHAGGSIMPEPDNRRNVNEFSIGIELVATPAEPFATAQYRSLAHLCTEIASRLGLTPGVLGHEHVAGARAVSLGLRAEAKVDPGRLFDWSRLTAALGAGAVYRGPTG
jgi:N-acetyl-anhydromuramyl-L-alanine amidase AmpD